MCFPKESDFLKNTLLWNEQSNLQDKRNDGEQLKDRKKKKKKVLLWSLHIFDTPEQQLKAQFNAAAGTSCPTALKCSTKSQSNTEMDKVGSLVYDLCRLNYTRDQFSLFKLFFLSIKIRCVDLYESDATEGIKNQHLHRYLTNTLIRSNNSSILPFVKFRPCLHS